MTHFGGPKWLKNGVQIWPKKGAIFGPKSGQKWPFLGVPGPLPGLGQAWPGLARPGQYRLRTPLYAKEIWAVLAGTGQDWPIWAWEGSASPAGLAGPVLARPGQYCPDLLCVQGPSEPVLARPGQPWPSPGRGQNSPFLAILGSKRGHFLGSFWDPLLEGS